MWNSDLKKEKHSRSIKRQDYLGLGISGSMRLKGEGEVYHIYV
jgi:hypothetical protein